MTIRNHGLTALIGLAVLVTVVYASSGDRSPTFQSCLKGCRITYCDPSQPPVPAYLRAFGWTCEDNCRYDCGHAFTDMIRTGSRYHQCKFLLEGPSRQCTASSANDSLWQMGILPLGTDSGTFLGTHVHRKLLGTLAGLQGGQAEDQWG